MTQSNNFGDCKKLDHLVREAHASRDAFGELFDHFYPEILTYCLRRLLVRATAEDVTAEAFLKVTANIKDFGGTTMEDFRRWVFRIATNEINAHLRQSLRRRDLLKDAARMGQVAGSVPKSISASDHLLEWDQVYRALDELSEREQSLLSLRFFAGFKHDQIADTLGMKTGNVRVALSRVLGKLRERLNSEEGTSYSAEESGGVG